MGFSLKNFMEDLEDIINDPFLSLGMKYEMLKEVIEKGKQYAKDCGQL